MKATVWTRWNTNAKNDQGRPKCIFDGEIGCPPGVGDSVVVREGFGASTVTHVIHDFVTGEVEIQVSTVDDENEYGPCLYKAKA